MAPSRARGSVGRMRSIHRKMSFAAFERQPRRLGWKYEYLGESAHITPAKLSVKFMLDLLPRPVRRRPEIRPLVAADAGALAEPFLAAFAHAPEYADYPQRLFRMTAAKYLTGFFGDVRGHWSPVSAVAEVGGCIVAAALVKQREKGPLLDCLYVHPEQGRQGWATALVSGVVRQLLGQGESKLSSCVHLANEPSLAWHEGFGFLELPDLWVATHRWRFHACELERLRDMKHGTETELTRLAEQEVIWRAEMERLEVLERRDFWSAHPYID